MPNFSILLPPSQGKKTGGNPFAPDMFDYRTSNTFNYFHDLNPERKQLIRKLQKIQKKGEGLEAILSAQGKLLEESIAVNHGIFEAPLMSALDRYSPGQMFKAMDFAGLPTGAQRRLLENGIIFSGLFGLLRPDDLIPNYRLRMDASLPDLGSVAAYWRPHLSALLNKTVEGRVVWNLLPGMHREAWDDTHTYKEMIDVRFFQEKDGERKALSHGVKPLRGQLVGYLVREVIEEAAFLSEWEHPEGYVHDEAASSYDPVTKQRIVVMVKKD